MSAELSTFERIIQDFEPGAVVRSTELLGGGISCTMTRVNIETAAGEPQPLVVRMVGQWSLDNYPESVKNEYEMLTYLGEQGIPVPKPRYFNLSGSFLPRPFVVFDYVEGSPDLTVTATGERAVAMANQLADIHSLPAHCRAFNHLKPSRVNIRPAGDTLNDDLQESRIRSVLEVNFPLVKENPYVFRHGDFWPGNMLWKDNTLAAVIDWEETSIGDPLFDVAIARLDILWAYGQSAMDEFTRQYLSRMPVDTTFLPFWELRVSLRPITNIAAWASSFPLLGRPDITAETMTAGHRWFVDQAIEQLDRP